VRSSLCSFGAAPTENTASSIVECWFTAAEMCLPDRCVASRAAWTTENTALLLLCVFVSAGMCLPSCCLAMNYSSFQVSCHSMDGQKIRDRFPHEIFLNSTASRLSWVHPAPCPLGTGDFPWGWSGWHMEADHSPPSSEKVKNMWLYTPPLSSWHSA
jgi:hypothetical protein